MREELSMPIELILKTLFKFMGVSEDHMREVFNKGQSLVVDGHAQISTMNRRLERIEAHLGIPPLPREMREIGNGERTDEE